MINFYQENDLIIFKYTQDFEGSEDWIAKELRENKEAHIKKTFTFTKINLYISDPNEEEDDDDYDDNNYFDELAEPKYFLFARKYKDYFRIEKGILLDDIDIYIHDEIEFDLDLFVVDSNVSILKILRPLLKGDFYLGGSHSTALPFDGYKEMLTKFPSSYEKKRYVEARVSAVLKEHLSEFKDGEIAYNKYMNKKSGKVKGSLQKTFKESELLKYSTLLERMESMLKLEEQFSEKQWQEQILQVLLLLYPKYIQVFREVPIKDPDIDERSLDYLLVDSLGYIDIVEIKKPFGKSIVTEGKYRNNYIPLRELSGTIMQLEKYIFYLNRWGKRGESWLTVKYKDQLPVGFEIKITNPSGIIIMGRENNLTKDQKADFEVVKRKYKNVVDIITYDNLIERLKATIEQIKKL